VEREALLRGSVHSADATLLTGSTVGHYYVTVPSYLADETHVIAAGGHDVHLAWLIPVHPVEADFVRERGWSALEDAFVEHDPNLCDLSRPPMLVGVRAAKSAGYGSGSLALVSPKILEGLEVRLAFREAALHEADSGWRFLSGQESRADLNDSKNPHIAALDAVVERDPSLSSLLVASVGASFEKMASSWTRAEKRRDAGH